MARSNHETVSKPVSEKPDRSARIQRLILQAEETFANPAKAHRWLRRPTAALAGVAPLDLLNTETGARRVGELLGRIAHGIAA